MRVTPIINTVYQKSYNSAKNENIQKANYNVLSTDNFTTSKTKNFISFKAQPNSGKLRELFAYNIRCFICGGEIIEPKLGNRLVENGLFQKSLPEVINNLTPLKECLMTTQKRVLTILEEVSPKFKNKTLYEVMQCLKPSFEKRLIKKQTPILEELTKKARMLPQHNQEDFKLLIYNTYKKINHEPVIVPFSSQEFKYKLQKLRQNAINLNHVEESHVIDRMLKISQKFANATCKKTEKRQQMIVQALERISYETGVIQNPKMRELFESSHKRLKKEKILLPFTRKSFLYDLDTILDTLPNRSLRYQMKNIAYKLPTSSDSTSAYIVKHADFTSEQIGYKLLSDSFGSADHILAHDLGGISEMKNYAPTHRKCNTDKSNERLERTISQNPSKNKKSIQLSYDSMVARANDGTFNKIGLPVRYLNDFKDTIYTESGKFRLVLNSSHLNPPPVSDPRVNKNLR